MRVVHTKSLITKVRILAEHVGDLSDELAAEIPRQTWTYLVETAAGLDEAADRIEERLQTFGPHRVADSTRKARARVAH